MHLQAEDNTETFGLFGVNDGEILALGIANLNMHILPLDNDTTDATKLIGAGQDSDYTLGSGGLVGSNRQRGIIRHSYTTGIVNVAGLYVGGLVGANDGRISYSYSTAKVKGAGAVGGLLGAFTNSPGRSEDFPLILDNSYATGDVEVGGFKTNITAVGGLVGALVSSRADAVTIASSYAANQNINLTESTEVPANVLYSRASSLIGYIDFLKTETEYILRKAGHRHYLMSIGITRQIYYLLTFPLPILLCLLVAIYKRTTRLRLGW